MKLKKRIGLLLIVIGLGALFLALIVTPNFTAKYLSSDHSLSPGGLVMLKSYRLKLSYLGVFITSIGAFNFISKETFLKAIYDWLIKNNGLVKNSEIEKYDWLIKKRELEKVVIGFFMLVGSYFRVYTLTIVGTKSPYILGGLFLEFAKQIADNGYILPKIIPFYTNGGIPFAYPPLSFYIEAFAVYTMGIKPFAVVNMLPVLITLLTLPSFYILVRAAGFNKWGRIIAFIAFALIPNAMFEQVEAGGLAESFGTLAIIWLFISYFRTLKNNNPSQYFKNFLLISIAWAFCIISSPGSAYVSILCFFAFSFFVLVQRNNKYAFLWLVFSGIVALILTSPYWLSVINNHGINVFLSSFANENSAFFAKGLRRVLGFEIVEGTYSLVWNIIILISLFIAVVEKKFFIITITLISFIIPRESHWALSVPTALLIGVGIERILSFKRNEFRFNPKITLIVLVGILILLFRAPLDRIKYNPYKPDSALHSNDLEAMEWMHDNTPPESKVIVISRSYVQEWVPQISRRTVINMPYGSEWQPDERQQIKNMENSLLGCENFDCVLESGEELVNTDQFILFADIDRISSFYENSVHAEFKLLWENEKIVVGTLCWENDCP